MSAAIERPDQLQYIVAWSTGPQSLNDLDTCAVQGPFTKADAIARCDSLRNYGYQASVIWLTFLAEKHPIYGGKA